MGIQRSPARLLLAMLPSFLAAAGFLLDGRPLIACAWAVGGFIGSVAGHTAGKIIARRWQWNQMT
jgi:hypothetical protein